MKQIDAVLLTQTLVRVDTLNSPGNEDACIRQLERIIIRECWLRASQA